MNHKPLITYHGDGRLFANLSSAVHQSLPQETVEWRRSYGRPPKSVQVDAKFIPFSDDNLLDETSKSLIDRPFFHTYWTDCCDLDTYKSSVKDDISTWLTKLKARNINDWLIINVENVEGKKGNKAKLLPRTTVLDKVKSDFTSKQSERCMSLLDPFKSDSRAAESWSIMTQRIRNLLLQSYNKVLSKFEENMRTQRERRNESGWNFCDYFLLQEELAFVYEMLGLYDEALVQYDELDALFTQFVLNSVAGETPDWLTSFCEPCNTWSGISLSPNLQEARHERKLITKHSATLLDFRNYLLCRQCSVLILLSRPWEVAQRSLPFMHNCVNELSMLEINMPPGSMACWVFLTCIEVLQTCEQFKDSAQIEAYSLYTADLWAYARDKLHELGIMCGLMPDLEESSEQLHMVVGLVCGMGINDSETEVGTTNPQSKLREALSSRTAFQKYYLEMSELAMGTFKHIGRIRSARLIGIDLAQFYTKLGEPHKASVFFVDALKMYEEEDWPELMIKTKLQLVSCYEKTSEVSKYVKACAQLATSAHQLGGLDGNGKVKFFYKMIEKAEMLDEDEPLLLKTSGSFGIGTIVVENVRENIVTGDDVKASVVVVSLFPEKVNNVTVRLTLKYNRSFEEFKHENNKLHKRDSWGFYPAQYRAQMNDETHDCLDLYEHYEYRQDGGVNSASVMCRNSQAVLSHSDSHNWIMKTRDPIKDESNNCMEVRDVQLLPGNNEVNLIAKAGKPGVYSLTQLVIKFCNMEFIQQTILPSISYHVISEDPSVYLLPISKSLLAGIEEEVTLVVKSGSFHIEAGTVINLEASAGLKIMNPAPDEHAIQSTVVLPEIKPFRSVEINVGVLAQLKPQKDTNTIQHRINVNLPSLSADQHTTLQLDFLPPFLTTYKSHSAYTRKFIQVQVHGLIHNLFELKRHELSVEIRESTEVSVLSSLNPYGQLLIVNNSQLASYIWELDVDQIEKEVDSIKFHFSIRYRPHDVADRSADDAWRSYSFDFKLTDFKTIYVLKSRIEPSKGSEFCRAGCTCTMHVKIQHIGENENSNQSLMYEVVVDPNMWTACGRTSGVVNIMASCKHTVSLSVMPLIGGFLPLPTVRLSKYIQAESTKLQNSNKDVNRNCSETSLSSQQNTAKLQPFSVGQVFNASRGVQVHVLPATTSTNIETPSL